MNKKIAIIGSGISGLVSGYLLSKDYDVYLFECNDYIGGHTRTIDVPWKDQTLSLDTGFIVLNKKTYPHFLKILNEAQVPLQASEMSFSYESQKRNFSYNGHNLSTLFADKRNIFSPKFYGFLLNITQFNAHAKKMLKRLSNTDLSVGNFLENHSYGKLFIDTYLKPPASAIWSCTPQQVLDFPLYFFLGFLENHGLLDVTERPQWYVIQGGSKSYIPALTQKFQNTIYLNNPVHKIRRNKDNVTFITARGPMVFDKVIIATHSDSALNMLEEPSLEEKSILSAIPYNSNTVTLHHDSKRLPKLKGNWASWNFQDNDDGACSLTYYLNRLQGFSHTENFCVSINLAKEIEASKIIKQFSFSHPSFSLQSLKAQQRFSEINGKNNTFYCGAYWGYGFHEDGVKSAILACDALMTDYVRK